MKNQFSFPQFRKYTNSASFFKIDSTEHFDEVKKMPSGFKHYSFQVKILPDRHYITDMLNCEKDYWVEISETDYELIMALVK